MAHLRSAPASVLIREKKNPGRPSLHFKKVGKLWSVRVGINHRALAVKDGADLIWVWIGPHDEYQRLVKQQA